MYYKYDGEFIFHSFIDKNNRMHWSLAWLCPAHYIKYCIDHHGFIEVTEAEVFEEML